MSADVKESVPDDFEAKVRAIILKVDEEKAIALRLRLDRPIEVGPAVILTGLLEDLEKAFS